MKRIILAAATLALLSTDASAWTCRASASTGAWGWGSGNYDYARRRALYECAIRTPRGYTCYINWCR